MAKRIRKRFKLFSVRAGLDMPFLFLVLILVAIGLVMMFSASYAYAYYNYGDSYMFIREPSNFAVLGIAAMFAISFLIITIFISLRSQF